jgi:hypothetical protein
MAPHRAVERRLRETLEVSPLCSFHVLLSALAASLTR